MSLDSSPELDAAIDSPEQQPTFAVRVSWDKSGDFDGPYDSLQGFDSLTINRSVSNSLPDQVSVISGEASAQANIKLVNGQTLSEKESAAWFYSRLNSESPLASYDRLDLPIEVDLGYRTSSSPAENLRKLTGTTTDLDVDVSAATANLVAVDRRTTLSGPVNLPAVVANEGDDLRLPNLDGHWLIDYILRQNGFDSSPSIRTNCCVFATFHGSAFPEVGELLEAWDSTDGVLHEMLTFTSDGVFGESLDAGPDIRATQAQGPNIWIKPDSDHPVSTNVGNRVHAEMWAKIGEDSTGVFSFIAHTTQGHFILWEIEDGVISVSVKRHNSASTHQVSATAITGDPTWRYIGLELEWSSTGTAVRLRINGTTYTGTVTSAFSVQMPAFNIISCLPDFPVEAWQITNLAPNVWRDTWESEVNLDPSINHITAVVDSEATDSWQLLKEIASAELGTIHFDEYGVFNFWSRAHWVTEDAQTVQKTVDISQQLKTIGYKDGIDQIANSVEAPVVAYTLGAAVDNLWVAPDSFVVVPGTSTTILDVDLGKAATGITTNFVPYYDPTRSWFEARVTPGGDLDYSSVTVKAEIISAQKVRITVNNTANSSRYLLESQNLPSIHLYGRPVTAVTQSNTNPILINQPSIDTYGLRRLTLPQNKWRQDDSSARGIAQAILSEIAYPNPALTSVNIPGDPRIQLGDRHQVNGGAGINGEYRIVKIRESLDTSGGYSQSLDYVKAYNVLIWDEGLWSDNFVWGA